MSDQNLSDELTHAAKLDPKRRGELAELAFMRKAANLGFAVAKPWGDSDRYDVVVRFDKTFWRVQIKSVLGKSPSRRYFRIASRNTAGRTYGRDDIDFLVAYLFAEDLWYVFPVHVVEQKKSVCLSPGSKKISLRAIPRELEPDAPGRSKPASSGSTSFSWGSARRINRASS